MLLITVSKIFIYFFAIPFRGGRRPVSDRHKPRNHPLAIRMCLTLHLRTSHTARRLSLQTEQNFN